MAKQLSDDEQNIRRKARRRLIGAFALTLAVVVILPMVLDSEPRQTGQDIELSIPAADEVEEFVTKIAAPDAATDITSKRPLVVPVEKPVITPGKVPVATGNSGTKATGKEQSAAIQKADPKSADKAVTESFVAQVGAFSDADRAEQELDRLNKLGYKAYTEKAGDMIRVRVGPYPDRDKAEKVRQELEKHGLHPVVMNAKGS